MISMRGNITRRGSMARWFMLVMATFVVVSLLAPGAEAKPAPVPAQEIADALKMLEHLDRMYSHIARPRFGKRSTPIGLYDGYLAPRQPMYNEEPIQGSEEWGVQFSRRR